MNTRKRILHIGLLMVLMLATSVGARAQASITINFDGNGGSGTPHSLTIYEGIVTEYLHNDFTMYGKQFAGWSVNVDDIGAVRFYEGDGITYDAIINEYGDIENMTFYAQWIPQQENSCGTGEAAHQQIVVIRNENPFPFIVWDDEHKVPLPEDLPDNWRETVWDRKYSTCIDNWRYTVHFYYRPANFEYDTIRIDDSTHPDQIEGKPVVWYGGTGYADEGDNHYIVIPVTYVELENSITQAGQGINEMQLEGEGYKMYGRADDNEIIYTYTLDHEWLQSHGYSRHENETIPETVEHNGKTYGFYYTIQVQQVNKYDPFHMDDIIICGGESVDNDKIEYNGDKLLNYHNTITDTWPMFSTLIDWGDGQSYWHQDPQYIFTATGDISLPGYAFELGVTYYPASLVRTDPQVICVGTDFGGNIFNEPGNYTNVEWIDGDNRLLYTNVQVVAKVPASSIVGECTHGTVEILTPEDFYCIGSTVLLEAKPDVENCYGTNNLVWSDGQCPNCIQRNFVITGTPITATFQKQQFSIISKSTYGDAGSVTLNGEIYTEGKTVACGENAILEATAKPGYIFVGWEDKKPDDCTGEVTTTENPRTFSDVHGEITVCAIFKQAVTINVTPNDGEKGTVTITDNDDNPITSGDQVAIGTELTITAAPIGDCNKFVRWSNGSDTNPLTINANGDIDIQAVFETIQYTITTAPDDATHGTTEAVEHQGQS